MTSRGAGSQGEAAKTSQSSDGRARRALITGITGQDGSYLAELLLEKGYEVHGIVRRVALEDPNDRLRRITSIRDKVTLHSGSLESYASLVKIVQSVTPDEYYHLAAQSFVSYAFEDEFSTINTNANGTHSALSAIVEAARDCRFYFAGSSEMFGNAVASPQNETTAFYPRSSYGISKLTGFHLTRYYREAHGLHASSGILFNHESPRRGYEFVTRKISRAVANIKAARQDQLRLGNLDAQRDWGHAEDYVTAMWLMLQQDEPDDYVIATGEPHSVKEFVESAFGHAGLDWRKYVLTDEALMRPAEIHTLVGDSSKARRVLKWQPSVSFDELVKTMVESDMKSVNEEIASRN